MNLKDWTLHFIKFRDSMKKEIVNITIRDNIIIAFTKTGQKKYFICENFVLPQQCDCDHCYYILISTPKNIEHLVQNWELFNKQKNVTFIIIDKSLHKKTMINPYNHSNYCDTSNLRETIATMLEES